MIFAPDHARVAAEARPGVQAGWSHGDHGLAPGQRRRRHLRRDVAVHAASTGAGSPFQWGEEAYVEERLGDMFELSFEGLDTRREDDDPAEMWELFQSSYGPSHVLWNSLDVERRRELDETMTAVFEKHRDGDGISMERRYIVVTGVRKG